MEDKQALEIIDKIFQQVFQMKNMQSLEEIKNKFAFDIKLPQAVKDSLTGEDTWSDCVNVTHFITTNEMEKKDREEGWLREKVPISSLEQVIQFWESINYVATERVSDSINVSKSDTIYRCENIYHATNCSDSKNIVFCDSCGDSEFLLASQRSGACNFGIRIDDSYNCSNSYNVVYSNKVSNSYFIQDCFNLYECMFCAHIANQKYCICNMPFEKEEYLIIKEKIITWIINS